MPVKVNSRTGFTSELNKSVALKPCGNINLLVFVFCIWLPDHPFLLIYIEANRKM